MSLYIVDSEEPLAVLQDGKYIEIGYLVTRKDFSDMLTLELEDVQYPKEIIRCKDCGRWGLRSCEGYNYRVRPEDAVEGDDERKYCPELGAYPSYNDWCFRACKK